MNMDNLDNLPPGLAQRLQEIAEPDDEVDYQAPSSWGVEHTSFDPSSLKSSSSCGTSSVSNPFELSNSSRKRGFAPALAPRPKKTPTDAGHYDNRFTFSTAVPDAPEEPTWTTRDFPSKGGERNRQQSVSSQSSHTLNGSEESSIGLGSRRIGALEATFGTEKVTRSLEGDGGLTPRAPSMRSGYPRCSPPSFKELDSRLENPELDIPENIRANFLPINRLHEVYSQQSGGGPITTQLGGETVFYNPRGRDTRLDHLDRNQNYIGLDLGAISKRLKRQHKENVAERDRQMLQATAEWRAWSAMSPDEITTLCEQLKKPVFFCGADEDDQYDELEIPDVYTRKVSMERIVNWMLESPTPTSSKPGSVVISSGEGAQNSSREASVDSFQPVDDGSDFDEFAVGQDFISLKSPVNRSVEQARKFIRNALDFKKDAYALSMTSESALFGGKSRSASDQARKQGSASRSSSVASSTLATISTYELSFSNPFTFDDSPELQEPTDYGVSAEGLPGSKQAELFKRASAIALKSGRVVVVRLHHPVKFTPGAIVNRVFGGIIQEMQLFPVQRIAVLIFLHCTEAKSFVRHAKSVYYYGNSHEIRMLQIDADWYKGNEKKSLMSIQANILSQHINTQATRALRLHRIPLSKKREELSAELGLRLNKMLITVVLCTPQQRYKQAAYGRQAVVEFASIKDALEARQALLEGKIQEYEDSEPMFTNDATIDPAEQRPYCDCCGCRDYRAARGR